MSQQIHEIALTRLQPHPHNPRGPVDPQSVRELADSIQEQGILEPLLIVPGPPAGSGAAPYLIVAGHRRAAAAELAGLNKVPCIIRTDLNAGMQERVMLIENLQREGLTPLQEARAYRRLMEQGATRADVARDTGVGVARIHSTLQILKLGNAVQEMFGRNELPVGAVAPLARVENLDQQERLAGLVARRQITVPALEKTIGRMVSKGEAKPPKSVRTTPPKPYGPTTEYSRLDAVQALEARNGASLTYTDLLKALNSVCDACGMKEMPAICRACPLPQYFHQLLGDGGAHAKG